MNMPVMSTTSGRPHPPPPGRAGAPGRAVARPAAWGKGGGGASAWGARDRWHRVGRAFHGGSCQSHQSGTRCGFRRFFPQSIYAVAAFLVLFPCARRTIRANGRRCTPESLEAGNRRARCARPGACAHDHPSWPRPRLSWWRVTPRLTGHRGGACAGRSTTPTTRRSARRCGPSSPRRSRRTSTSGAPPASPRASSSPPPARYRGSSGWPCPEEYGGGGVADFRFNAVLGEELLRARRGAPGCGSPCTTTSACPTSSSYCTDEQKRALAARHRLRRHDHRDRHDRARHRLRPARRSRTTRDPRRRRLRRQRLRRPSSPTASTPTS